MTTKFNYEVAVIGAGPAGIMAAIKSSELGLSVVLIEKNKSMAKKLLMSGGGRCNLSNAEFDLQKLVKNYNNGEFLFHAFSVFGPKETIEFFEKIGVKTKIEKSRKVFPASNDAGEVSEALEKYLADKKVKIILDAEVTDIESKNNKITKIVLKSGEVVAKKYILATGGKSYPATGSTGFGYKIAQKLGHTIVQTLPALSPIILKDEWVKGLQGISLPDVKVSVLQNNKKIISDEGDIIFTHFGIGGPTILNISSKVSELLEKGETKICLDLFPLLNQEELLKGFEEDLKKYPNKSIKNILTAFVPAKLADALLSIVRQDKDQIANNMSKIEREKIVKTLKNIELTAEDVMGFDVAKVTKGGISLSEIDHKTMQSKIIENLFFAGEIIDVDGKSGGFNLQLCWSTGYLAGLTK